MCEYLRYAGAMGWDKKAGRAVAEKLGFKPSPTTIHIQWKAGKDGGKVPSVDKSVANQLAALIADIKF
jgi:hypothetical protein